MDGPPGKRGGAGFATISVVAVGVMAAAAVVLLALGAWKWLVRATAPMILDGPAGPWVVGCALGLVTAIGGIGGLHFAAGPPGGAVVRKAVQGVGTAACAIAVLGPLMYLLAALPGRNCSSTRDGCAYIPGTGSALVAYVVSAGVLGWVLHRRRVGRLESRRAEERERLRKLRKRGKGRSRAAGGRRP